MSRATLRGVVAASILVCLLSAAAAGVATAAAGPLVRTAHNARLNATILVASNGRTLYHLSVEKKGHFICTDRACLSFWHPLVVSKGTTPKGTVPLGTVRRPDGRVQVTYKGGPLYTFAQDAKRGDAGGEGFKDVGVWHAATVRRTAATTSSGSTANGGYGG